MKLIVKYLKYSWWFVSKYKHRIIVIFFLDILNAVVVLYSPMVYAELISAIAAINRISIKKYLLISIAVQLLSVLLGQIKGRIENSTIRNATIDTRKKLQEQIFSIPPDMMKNFDQGMLFSLLTNDSASPISFIFTLKNACFNICTLLGIGIIIFFISWQMALITLSVYPIIYIINKLTGKLIRKEQELLVKDTDATTGFLKDILVSINFIKRNNGQKKVNEKFCSSLNIINEKGKKLEKIKFNNSAFIGTIGVISYIAINIIGVFLIVTEKLLFSEFVAFSGYSSKFTKSLDTIVSLNTSLQPIFVSFGRLEKITDSYKNYEKTKDSLLHINTEISTIKVNDLSICLSDKQIFHDINVYVKNGECVNFSGKNGSGKTTLLKVLMKEYNNYKGDIFINGTNLRELDYKDIQLHFSYLQQNSELLPLTLYDNITLFDTDRHIGKNDVIKACKKVGLWDDIANLPNGLDTVKTDNFNLSSGQLQKLQFVRALLKKSDAILIDEITANLDVESVDIILNLSEQLKKEGKIIFYVSHSHNAEYFIDKKIKME